MAGSGSKLESSLLLVTGAFTLVYVVGTAAAIRLLPRGTLGWRCAVVSFGATLGLLWMTGVHISRRRSESPRSRWPGRSDTSRASRLMPGPIDSVTVGSVAEHQAVAARLARGVVLDGVDRNSQVTSPGRDGSAPVEIGRQVQAGRGGDELQARAVR